MQQNDEPIKDDWESVIVPEFWSKIKGYSQTEFLTKLRWYMRQYPDYAYYFVYYASKSKNKPLNRDNLRASRHQFNKKYRKKSIPKDCYLCDWKPEGIYFVRHHLIALRNGGTNRRMNLIILCSRCHCYFHPWLWKNHNERMAYYEVQRVAPRIIAPKASAYHS